MVVWVGGGLDFALSLACANKRWRRPIGQMMSREASLEVTNVPALSEEVTASYSFIFCFVSSCTTEQLLHGVNGAPPLTLYLVFY